MNAYHDKKWILSSEWNVESAQNLKFPEDMIEVTQIASFLHKINLEAQKTIIEQDTALISKHKAKNYHRNCTEARQPENMPSVSEYALILHAFSFKTLDKAHKRTRKQKRKSISGIEQIIEREVVRKATNQKNECKKQMCVVPAYFSCIHASKPIDNINTLEQDLQGAQIGHKAP